MLEAYPLHPMNLKHFPGLALAALLATASVHAQTFAVTTDTVPTAVSAVNKHAAPILAALKLGDAAKAAKVNEVVTTFFNGLNDWHHQNDAALKGLWNEFNHGRSKKDRRRRMRPSIKLMRSMPRSSRSMTDF